MFFQPKISKEFAQMVQTLQRLEAAQRCRGNQREAVAARLVALAPREAPRARPCREGKNDIIHSFNP